MTKWAPLPLRYAYPNDHPCPSARSCHLLHRQPDTAPSGSVMFCQFYQLLHSHYQFIHSSWTLGSPIGRGACMWLATATMAAFGITRAAHSAEWAVSAITSLGTRCALTNLATTEEHKKYSHGTQGNRGCVCKHVGQRLCGESIERIMNKVERLWFI